RPWALPPARGDPVRPDEGGAAAAIKNFPAPPLHQAAKFRTIVVCRWRSSAVERLICNQRVGGSIPSASSSRGEPSGRPCGVGPCGGRGRVGRRPFEPERRSLRNTGGSEAVKRNRL